MLDRRTIEANWEHHVGDSRPFTPQEMEERVARFNRLKGSPRTFVDTHIPGHERTLFSVIGAPGGSDVHEDPDHKPMIPHAQHFVMDYIEAPPGCGAALHSHDSEEVFVAISGQWEVSWGDEGEHKVVLNEHDVISVPPFVMRAFKNLGNRKNLLMSVLGGANPSRVKWARKVATAAKARGVGFDAKGNMVKLA